MQKTKRGAALAALLAGVGAALLAAGIAMLLTALPVSGAEDALIAPGAKQAERIEYTRCGHMVLRRMDVAPEMVGMTRERAEEALAGAWRLEAFSARLLTVSQQRDMFCPAHWVLMMDEKENTAVYRNTDGANMERMYDCAVTCADEETRAQLRHGMAFDTPQELEAAAEAIRATQEDQRMRK